MKLNPPPIYTSNDSQGMQSWFQSLWHKLTNTSQLTSGTVQATTSGTSIDFTNIPSWVKRITVSLSGVSTNGTSVPLVQLGDSGGIEATGYLSATADSNGTGATNYTTGFGLVKTHAATFIFHGTLTLTLLNSSTFLWACQFTTSRSDGGAVHWGSGSKALSATLDRVRLTTVNGTDTFDAGSVNILYE